MDFKHLTSPVFQTLTDTKGFERVIQIISFLSASSPSQQLPLRNPGTCDTLAFQKWKSQVALNSKYCLLMQSMQAAML